MAQTKLGFYMMQVGSCPELVPEHIGGGSIGSLEPNSIWSRPLLMFLLLLYTYSTMVQGVMP